MIDDLPLPHRPNDAHKGTFGRVLVVGGSVGMSGAVCLAASAALRGGAGLVTAAVPQSIQSVVAGFEPSYMTVGLPADEHGALGRVEAVEGLLAGKSAVVVGPGLGQTREAADLVLAILKQSPCPVVLDADALNLVAEYEILRSVPRNQPLIVTPHPGEFSRLTGQSISAIQASREQSARDYAVQHEVTVVLKGAGTIVTDGVRVYKNTAGNAGMATGGTGDVLAGLLAAQVAVGLEPMQAASLAVYVHGLAGDLAAAEFSEPGLIASDVLRCIGAAWRNIQNSRHS